MRPVTAIQRARILGMTLGLSAGMTQGALPFLDLTRTADSRGWEPSHQVSTLRTTPMGLELDLMGDDPFLTSPPLGLGGTNELMIELRCWSEAGGIGQLFWFKDNATEEASAHFRVRDHAWTDVCLAMPALGDGWRFRIDPPGTHGVARLAWLRVSPRGSRGITRIGTTQDSLVFSVEAQGPFEVVELRPDQELESLGNADVVLRSTGPGSRGGSFEVKSGEGVWNREKTGLGGGFVVRQKDPLTGYHPVGPIRHVEDFGGVNRRHPPAVRGRSRKGLQVQMVDDAIALGVQQAALNVNLAGLIAPGEEKETYEWTRNGRQFHFRKAAVDAIPVKVLSDTGAAVTLILLAYESGNPGVDRILLNPGYTHQAPNHLGGFNTVTQEGAEWFAATVGFLAEWFSQPDAKHGRAVNFIIGNEVTAHWHWYHEGEVPPDLFIADYVNTVRLANAAAQEVTDSIRVHLSFDHHWNLTYGGNPNRAIPGRRLLDGFNRVAGLGGNFDWNVAYHPYPEDLRNPKTWEDRTALPSSESPRITFRNLEVLTDYLGRPELLHHGQPRRVILSEQGFNSDGTVDGERFQAAAYAYAWEKVAGLPGIDAFILHRHVDHQLEGGLNLGLWRRKPGSVADPDTPKPIYEVFKAADTPAREEAFRFALPLVGMTNWTQLHRR